MKKGIGKSRWMFKISTLLLFLAVSIQTVYAGEGSGSVTVSYTPSGAYPQAQLSVQAEGKGSVLDESSAIREGTVVYTMQEGDEKSFTLKPDEGYEVKKIEFQDGYESRDLLPETKEGKIHVTMKDRDSVLLVRFEEKAKGENPGNKTEQSFRIPGVKTGDGTGIGFLLAILAGAACISVLLLKKRKKNQEEA